MIRMTRRRRRSRQSWHPAVLLVALIAVLAVVHAMIGVIGLVLIVAASTGAAYYAGLRSRPVTRARTTPAANARSLAQLNRHLNERLDATQVKLEAAMDRADRAEEAARDTANAQ